MQKNSTSWETAGKWYNKTVGDRGHYYHQHVVIPGVIRLLGIDPKSSVLDIGCGQGVLARALPKDVFYTGIDLAKNLINFAQQQDKNNQHTYLVADATKRLSLPNKNFTHAAAILCLQNMEFPQNAIQNASEHLGKNGRFVLVLNHPAFRIPRQSGWGTGENKLQYRYENVYLSSQKIPITMHPGEMNSAVTWSFHHPISFYVEALSENGFVIEKMEEWVSDKESVGKAAKMENRSRSEFPLFLTIVARKI
ncbi:MAG TPA: class I SAM-dependent methyltransferase [Candidatus Saccharimonadales bacterium]|nr:class I SAM-dependent methyltransferase [Candidatus Saccharimonadales bacterium]